MELSLITVRVHYTLFQKTATSADREILVAFALSSFHGNGIIQQPFAGQPNHQVNYS